MPFWDSSTNVSSVLAACSTKSSICCSAFSMASIILWTRLRNSPPLFFTSASSRSNGLPTVCRMVPVFSIICVFTDSTAGGIGSNLVLMAFFRPSSWFFRNSVRFLTSDCIWVDFSSTWRSMLAIGSKPAASKASRLDLTASMAPFNRLSFFSTVGSTVSRAVDSVVFTLSTLETIPV